MCKVILRTMLDENEEEEILMTMLCNVGNFLQLARNSTYEFSLAVDTLPEFLDAIQLIVQAFD